MELVTVIFSVSAFLFATFALIEVKAMQRSTHKVSFFNPQNQEFSALTDAQKKDLLKDPFDNI